MFWKPAAGSARLVRAVLGGCLAFAAAPIHAQAPASPGGSGGAGDADAQASVSPGGSGGAGDADAQETTLQASFAGRSYVLVERSGRAVLAEEGGQPIELPGAEGAVYDSLAALDAGWLAAGHRPADRGGRELVLLQGSDGGTRSLPAPPSGERLIASARPLIEGGALVGLAWLEGDDTRSLGIRTASWTGAGFAAAEWVAPPSATGSQLALAATVLRDGTWLLVWSAFDGVDDEILFSWRDGSEWSEPARLHAGNQVPDITPAVAATSTGAVAAWSRYEAGHYRVRVARFREGSWSAEERIGGAGSVFPFFVTDGDGRAPHLVFPVGAEGDWEMLALGAAGQVRTRSRVSSGTREQPLVRRTAGGGARLVWLGAGAASARRER